MSAVEALSGVRGAKVQTWKATNPRELLKRIIEDNPGSDRTAVLHVFRDQMWREDEAEDYVDTIIEYWFANNYHSLVGNAPVPRDRLTGRRATEAAASQIAERVRKRIAEQANIVLSEMMMPNGKRLAECTGRECLDMGIAIGGWLGRVARKVKASQLVGEVCTEEALQEIYRG